MGALGLDGSTVKPDDLRRMRRPFRVPEGKTYLPHNCRVCGHAATCPMLEDDVWALLALRGCAPRGPRVPDLLCFECTEALLGRKLELDDLLPCLGNYATYVFATR